MYANAPHASAATSPLSPQIQHQPQVQQHGHPQGMPTAGNGGPHGMYGQAAAASPVHGHPARATTPASSPGATFVTGAYQASGDPGIDRMLRLEAALKRFGSPI
jgi:hypothetical protein